jgi:hypothetical protein
MWIFRTENYAGERWRWSSEAQGCGVAQQEWIERRCGKGLKKEPCGTLVIKGYGEEQEHGLCLIINVAV